MAQQQNEMQCDGFTVRRPPLIVAENFSFIWLRVGWSSSLNENSLMHLWGVEYITRMQGFALTSALFHLALIFSAICCVQPSRS